MVRQEKQTFNKARTGWVALILAILVTLALNSGSAALELGNGTDEAYPFTRLETTITEGFWANYFNPPGTNGRVYTLLANDQGNLYLGGEFTTTGKVTTNHVAM